MTLSSLTLFLYLVPMVLVLALYWRQNQKKERCGHVRLKKAIKAGLTEPPSLHPIVNATICIGSSACVNACPEKALGIVKGKSLLVAPALCIGHGACQAACPVDAISLVFGTEKRGMDIPHVTPSFETNVPGIFIAGELGGMGLVRKAVEQGKQAMDTIRKEKGTRDEWDVVIIGAGPAGIAASLAAKQYGVRAVTIEQEDSLGGAVYHYPRHKLTMTSPVHLPLVGEVKMYEVRKEELLGLWEGVLKQTGIEIRYSERMQTVTRVGSGFLVTTSKNQIPAKRVLLAMGRRGTPRKLGVPGEEQPKVVYRLIDPEQYRGQHVLVVGGGDSAAEAALALADEPGTAVSLSYRGENFGRLKPKNRKRLQESGGRGVLQIYLQSEVSVILGEEVILKHVGQSIERKNDAVIVCAGGILPTPFLKEIGVMVDTHHGTVALR